MNILYCFMYRKMDMPGRKHLLGITELYAYYVLFCMLMYRRLDRPGRMHLLGSKELYEYYVLVYVQEDVYARADISARFNGTI